MHPNREMKKEKCHGLAQKQKWLLLHKRVWASAKHHWWKLIGPSFVIVTALGTYGYWIMLRGYDKAGFWDYLYHALQLYPMQFGIPLGMPGDFPLRLNGYLNAARFAAPIVLGFATINALWIFFQERFSLFIMRRRKNHIIVCGLGNKGMQLVDLLAQDGEKVLSIEKDKENDNVGICKSRGIGVLLGHAADEGILKSAGIEKAKSVYAITGDDTANIEVAVTARRIAEASHKRKHGTVSSDGPGEKDRLDCFVHLYDPNLKSIFETVDLFQSRYPYFDARIFNFLDESSRNIIALHPPDRYHRERVKELGGTDSGPVHVLVVGFGFMGESLVKHIMRVAHYDIGLERVKITIVDKVAEEKKKQFLNLCEKPSDIELEFVSADIENTVRMEDLNLGSPPSIGYIALGSDPLSISTAVRLRKVFDPESSRRQDEKGLEKSNSNKTWETPPPIVVCLTTALSELFAGCTAGRKLYEHENIFPVNIIKEGMNDVASKYAMIEQLAQCIHADYFVNAIIDIVLDKKVNPVFFHDLIHPYNDYDKFNKLSTEEQLKLIRTNLNNILRRDDCPEDLKNYTFTEWEELDEGIRDSNRYQADHLAVKVRAMGFDLEINDPLLIKEKLNNEALRTILARMEHRRWTAEKYLVGWKYGGKKDKNKKTHYDLVPFDSLKNREQKKDENAIKNIPSLVSLYQEIQKASEKANKN